MHQPSGATVPSTVLQEEGGSNSAQLSQRASPFGVSWYFTAFCDTFAACAGLDAPTIPATPLTAPAAPAATVNTWRREIPIEFVMARYPPSTMIERTNLIGSASHHIDLEQFDLRRSGGVDLIFASHLAASSLANVKSKTPLERYVAGLL